MTTRLTPEQRRVREKLLPCPFCGCNPAIAYPAPVARAYEAVARAAKKHQDTRSVPYVYRAERNDHEALEKALERLEKAEKG